MMLLEATFSVPWLEMPPPAMAELPLTVQLVSVVVLPSRELYRPPPLPLAELPLTVQLVSVAVLPIAVVHAAAAVEAAAADGELPLTVQLVSVAVPPR